MNEEVFNLELRKFLKHFGINAQRAVEKAVASALESGELGGNETLSARATLSIEGLSMQTVVEGEIALE